MTTAVGAAVPQQPDVDGAPVPGEHAPRRPAGWPGRLRDALFPEAPTTPVTPRRIAVAAAFVGFGVVYSLGRVRGPGAGALDTVWAEDGANFLHDAANMTPYDAFTTPLNGYYHFFPRFLAEITTLLPVSAWAACNATLAALTTAGLALIVYAASGAHLRHPVLRLLVAVPVVAQWAANGEIVDNVATLQFPALYTLFWVLLAVQARRVGKLAAPVFALVVALSTTLTITLLPLALVRAGLRRDRAGILMAAAMALGVGVQLYTYLSGEAEREIVGMVPNYDPLWNLKQFAELQVPVTYLGESWIRVQIVHTSEHRALVLLAWAILLTAVGLAVWRRTRPAWLLAGVAAVHAVGLFALQIAMRGGVPGRYLLPSLLLLVAGTVALLRPRSWTGGTSWWGPEGFGTVPIVALATLLTVVAIANYRHDHIWRTTSVPSWSKQVTANAALCRADPDLKAVVFRSGPASKRMWGSFAVPCSRLR
ncbi:hypothetical protein RB614_40810 [Phytohabitans sp. ZYX-F-186]|uniref:Glycosyltransferase RgtA/B/C/D-like domain-containing protein n=1 Tax=Phytohabitans maris TaxID=3071409 RepID=A0ABU0ZV80_9ACTN|nr:hypothetical protein [Phytohabitans sp. ZYX-F-186]MDQ7910853.1 hypothetical protein [Phytohabitans sp. ZYX-F-186]